MFYEEERAFVRLDLRCHFWFPREGAGIIGWISSQGVFSNFFSEYFLRRPCPLIKACPLTRQGNIRRSRCLTIIGYIHPHSSLWISSFREAQQQSERASDFSATCLVKGRESRTNTCPLSPSAFQHDPFRRLSRAIPPLLVCPFCTLVFSSVGILLTLRRAITHAFFLVGLPEVALPPFYVADSTLRGKSLIGLA